MHICFVLEHFPPHIGGVEIVFDEIATRLVEQGHCVRVVTSDSGGVIGQVTRHGFEVFYFKSLSFFGHPLLNAKAVAPHIQWADVVHTTTYTAAPLTSWLCWKYRKPCVVSIHEVLGKKWFLIENNPIKALAFLLFEWFVIKCRYDAYHVISLATQRDLLNYFIPTKKTFLAYPGIDESVWNENVHPAALHEHFGIDALKKVFLYTGRPGKPKGIFVLLNAIEKVHPKLPDTFVFGCIMSQDPLSERQAFEKLVKAKRLEKRVFITPSVPYQKLPALRKGALAIIVPSLTEGFGFSAVETAAIHTPVIASTAGSLPEVLGGRVLFFENGNASDLADKILLASLGKYQSLPEKSFHWDDTVAKVSAIYRKLITH
jgi:glycosyltransferase involved in cell wall biosynthesis